MNEVERRWVIVAFGDIRGFVGWSRRASGTREVRDPFISQFYGAIDTFVRKTKCYVKYLGDGLMILREIPLNGDSGVDKFLVEIKFLTREMKRIIQMCEWPKPDGFRTRVVVGHVDRISVTDPADHGRTMLEYVGYSINLAQRLLDVRPAVPVICHESVVKTMNSKKPQIKFRRVVGPIETPKGVDVEDILALWIA